MSGFRVGLADGLLYTSLGPTAMTRANYLTAAAARADSFWVVDHLNALIPRSIANAKYIGSAGAKLLPRPDAIGEPWTMLGYLAAKNRSVRLRLGVGVTDAGRRNPAVTAQAAATLHLLTRGRAILGIGTGEREGNEPYGVDWSKPVGRLIEALATIRALWDSSGELVTRDSPFFPLHNAIFDLPPYRGKWPEIWVAAHRPRMLRATGRYADGWFPGAVYQPEEYAAALDVVRTAASGAGRDPLSIVPASYVFVVTGRSRDEVDEALGSQLIRAFALIIPAAEWARHGGRHPFGDDFMGMQDIIPQTLDEETVLAATKDVPESLLRQSFFTGTPDDVVDQAARLRDSGLRYAVLFNLSFAQPNMKRSMAATVPFTRILRQLRKL
jgi:phthiodiolone/phenolphthiodiolone dimycocerosates ketoreductase